MPAAKNNRPSWLKSSFFWRTFIMVTMLIVVSMGVWTASFRLQERKPLAKHMASQVISIVTITRAALLHADIELQRELLFDLASNEGIRIYPLEKTDRVALPTQDQLMMSMQAMVRARLGADTRFAANVNGIPGFWVSFKIAENDEYWLVMERGRLRLPSGWQWLGWAAVVLALSLLGAAIISRRVSYPLSRLAFAARTLARGKQPELLAEKGSAEVVEANHSFNQMVQDLNRVESERALILAGISHDLRTPLARMQLEIEMANLSDAERQGMQSDIAQMNDIIGQFLDYARPSAVENFMQVDLSLLLKEAVQNMARHADVALTVRIDESLMVMGNATELRRAIGNLLENARRYGKSAETGVAQIEVNARLSGQEVRIEIADHGTGLPENEIEHMLRPFTRQDAARGQAQGAGLGLAIVNRIIQQHGGKLVLQNRETGGLVARITLPG